MTADDMFNICKVSRLTDELAKNKAKIDRLSEQLSAALVLSAAVTDYRHTHDMKGDGHIETGRAWDHMRRANDDFRFTLRPDQRPTRD